MRTSGSAGTALISLNFSTDTDNGLTNFKEETTTVAHDTLEAVFHRIMNANMAEEVVEASNF